MPVCFFFMLILFRTGATGFWLPLEGGQLYTPVGSTRFEKIVTLVLIYCYYCFRVTSLAWNAEDKVLYIGGLFSEIDNTTISGGIAMWTYEGGLQGLPTGGVTNTNGDFDNCIVTSLAFEPKSKVGHLTSIFNSLPHLELVSVCFWFL